jgi:hypothetical protein
MQALGGYVWGELRGVVHLGVKQALAVIASHYNFDLERVCDGYMLPNEPELATAEMQRLNDVVEGPRTSLAHHFKVEVVPPPSLPTAIVPLQDLLQRHEPGHRPAGNFDFFVIYAKNMVDVGYQTSIICCVVFSVALCPPP